MFSKKVPSFESYTREAAHAGSWYSNDGVALRSTVAETISKAIAERRGLDPSACGVARNGVDILPLIDIEKSPQSPVIALFGPHAGLRFSGRTNAHAYSLLRPTASTRRIFLVGPSHHRRMVVEVSGATHYAMPWGRGTAVFPCDAAVLKDIQGRCASAGLQCAAMSRDTDEDEHSLEMHMPFVAHALEGLAGGYTDAGRGGVCSTVAIVPVLLGQLSPSELQTVASAVLAPYFGKQENLFVFSTDFCHWGSRFGYTYRYESQKYDVIGDGIWAMDLEGMRRLAAKDVGEWHQYLAATQNTICGRHPLSVLLHLVNGIDQTEKSTCDIIPAHYSQSERVTVPSGSSVSYGSGVVTLRKRPPQ